MESLEGYKNISERIWTVSGKREKSSYWERIKRYIRKSVRSRCYDHKEKAERCGEWSENFIKWSIGEFIGTQCDKMTFGDKHGKYKLINK